MGDSLGGMKRLVGRLWDEAKTSLYRNAIYLMATNVLGQGLGFFYYAIVTRLYLSSDIGFAVTLFSTTSFVSILALLGFNVSLIRYLPEAEDQADLLNTVLTTAALAGLLLWAGFLGIIAVFGLGLGFVFQTPWYPIAILAGLLASALAPILDTAAIALRRSEVQTWRVVALGFLKMGIAVALAVLVGTQTAGWYAVFLALVLATVGSVLIEATWLLPKILPGYRVALRTKFGRLRSMMRFSNGNYVANTIGAAGTALLPLLVLDTVADVGPTQAAYFYVASTVAALLTVISGATFTSFFAEASYRNASRHTDERRALLLTLGLLVPAIVVFWLLGYYVLELFGATSEYANAATTPLRIMTLASIPAVANNLLVTRVRVRRRTRPLIVGAILTTAVVLGLGYYLLQNYGITGLSAAVVVASVAPTPYYWAVARKSFEAEPLEPLEPVVLQP